MSGLVCLQGGREFTPDCDEMDRSVVARAGVSEVVVLAGAARIGSDHDGAVDRALGHYRRLGIDGLAVPDPRTERADALDALARLDAAEHLVVLPGGSPGSLLDVLGIEGIGDAVLAFHSAGGAISGASAGAMVLCDRMVRPDRGDVVAALGIVDGLALPHWTTGSDRGWPVADVDLWGLPECGGVVLASAHDPVAVGRGTPARRRGGRWVAVDR